MEHKSREDCSVKQSSIQIIVSLCKRDVIILGYNNLEVHLFTLEAILQYEIRPKMTGKEEFIKNIIIREQNIKKRSRLLPVSTRVVVPS